jgi:hypothetical protein
MRCLLLIVGLLLGLASTARAQDLAWEACAGRQGEHGPALADCRPLAGVIDPQGRELWLRARVPAPTDERPRTLHLVGVASTEAWLNSRRLGANGRPGASAAAEQPGRYQAALPIEAGAWRPEGDRLVLHMSSFHGGLRFAQPIGVVISSRGSLLRPWLLAVAFVAVGALLAAAFGFGVIHALRRTGSSLMLAVMAAVAALQAIVESLRPLFAYPYPLHAWRVGTIWLLAATFSILLVAYIVSRFRPRARSRIVGVAAVVVLVSSLAPGFDLKTGLALFTGVVFAAGVCAVRWRRPGARAALIYFTTFILLAVAFPEWLIDLSFFLFAACLILPLLMVEVVRLSRDDRAREEALTRAVTRPDRLAVASARGVELVPVTDILAVVGADDYVELRLPAGRRLLHAARLDRLEAQLSPGFLRVHRSVIANLSQVRGLERDGDRWRLRMAEDELLPVSRARLAALREALEESV